MNYEKMNVTELKKICKEMSIPTAGKKKNEMIVAIKEKDRLDDKQNIGLVACEFKEEISDGDSKINESDIGTDEFNNPIQKSLTTGIKVNESAKKISENDTGTDEFSNSILKSSKPDIKVNESAKKNSENDHFFDKNISQDLIISNDENDEIIIEKTNVVINEKYIEEDILIDKKNANKFIKAPIEDNLNKINVKYDDTNESEETIKKMEKKDLKERGLEVKEAAIESAIDLHKQINQVKTPDDIAQTILKGKEEEENSLRDKKVLEDEIKEFNANENSTEEGEIKKRKFNGYNIIIKDVHEKLTEIAQMNEDERIKARKKRFGNFEKK